MPFECQFDRGGIDPGPIILSVEAGSKKKTQKPTSVPSPGSSNSQDSFPAPPTGNIDVYYSTIPGQPGVQYPQPQTVQQQQEYGQAAMPRPPSQSSTPQQPPPGKYNSSLYSSLIIIISFIFKLTFRTVVTCFYLFSKTTTTFCIDLLTYLLCKFLHYTYFATTEFCLYLSISLSQPNIHKKKYFTRAEKILIYLYHANLKFE